MTRSRLILLASILLSLFSFGCGSSSSDFTTYTVGGTVSGLSGAVVLQLNGAHDLTITQNGSFTFTAEVAEGTTYEVTVRTHPSGQFCAVTNASGTANSNVSNVTVTGYNSGILDQSFSTDGIQIYNDIYDGSDYGHDVAVDEDGKILVVGEVVIAGNADMALWRYNTDGSLDTDFGSDGVVGYDSGYGDDGGYDLTLDSDGNILVVGWVTNASGNYDMALWRYTFEGILDTTFNSSGSVPGLATHNNAALGVGHDMGYRVVLTSAGKILIAGESERSPGNADLAVWQYNANGTLDTAFGESAGVTTIDSTTGGVSGNDRGYGIAVDNDGKILVAGEGSNGVNYDMVLYRFTALGEVDTLFNGGLGYVLGYNTAGGTGATANDSGRAIALDNSGRILVTGYSYTNAGIKDMVIWRYSSSGVLDSTFSGDGIVLSHNAAGGTGDTQGEALAIDASGRILVTGFSRNPSLDYDMVIWRYTSTGILDTTFNSTGIVINGYASGGSNIDFGESLALDTYGRIIVAGESQNSNGDFDMTVWRCYP